VALLRVFRSFPRQISVLDAPYTYGGPITKNKPKLSDNEPYYADCGKSSRNYGIGMGVIPFNRLCPVHGGSDDFWRRRARPF
jgi:hypothetical protein